MTTYKGRTVRWNDWRECCCPDCDEIVNGGPEERCEACEAFDCDGYGTCRVDEETLALVS